MEAIEQAAALEPDVVLMDVRMPTVNGIEAARRIRVAQPTVRVLMLTESEDEDDLFGAVRAGATGYLLKEVAIDEIADAIRSVANGQALVSPLMTTKLLSEFNALSRRLEEEHDGRRLTDRELEVLRLIARGMSNKDIGSRARHRGEHRAEPRAQHPGETAGALAGGGGDVRRPGEAGRRTLTRAGPRPGPALDRR